ncbi:MAG: preprotein translocase subunit SecE [Pseudomonadota bacterium]|nr:preprotein translocase subunit SecE [Pseudomonadota bacterium]
MAESEKLNNNTPLLLLSMAILIVGIWSFYYFAEIRLFYRVLALISILVVSSLITYQTDFGKTVYTYITDSKIELKKVVWPTKQETTQTALGVLVVVIIIGILLWLFDMLLGWAVGTLYGVR